MFKIFFYVLSILYLKCCANYERIVGGKDASPNAYPWMVSIMIRKGGLKLLCGGTIISNNFVLTAAHCTKGLNNDDVSIIFINHDLKSSNGTSSTILRVIRIIEYKNYVKNYNDIALLEFENYSLDDKNSRNFPSICLPKSSNGNFTDKTAKILGWGKLSYHGPHPHTLQEANVKIISNKKCFHYYRKFSSYFVNKRDICAGSRGKDACLGDSGGPLLIKEEKGSFVQIGIVKFGVQCGFIPGLYTRVSKYLKWINENVKNLRIC